MKIIYLAVFILLLCNNAYSMNFFADKGLHEIHVVRIIDDVVYIRDKDGVEEEVVVGDIICSEGAEVVEIGADFIAVQTEEQRVMIQVSSGTISRP